MADVIAARSHSVLVVDDDADSADSLALLLEHWNHRVFVAYDGAHAVEVFRRQHPEIDGYEVARALRREEHPATLVALTGYGSESDRLASREAGFDLHFVKPLDIGNLKELLDQS
jgi:two-component system, chemotaxis family, CheB/CheR fusion protein